ncbi:EF hand domain-containing protein [Sphingomonas sp. PP-CE-1A-559]|nr:EF hand domain-containing protein [Sphingomonas sp. PP-CE-1A-559]
MTGGMLLALALLQAIVAAPPPAGTPQPPATIFAEPAALFIAACDANGDGRVTQAELTAGIVRSYATAEGAASGSIGYIAFADWAQAWLGDRNALPSPFEVDRDGDNRITLVELQARFSQFFARFDRDKDGVLTRAELITIRGAPAGDRYGIRKKK